MSGSDADHVPANIAGIDHRQMRLLITANSPVIPQHDKDVAMNRKNNMDFLELMTSGSDESLDVEIIINHPLIPMMLSMKGNVRVISSPRVDAETGHKMNINTQIRRINQWERENLPYPSSRIARELFIMLGQDGSNAPPLSVKTIVLTTGYSERAVRQQLKQFESDGWIVRTQGRQDKRNITIVPTQSLQQIFRKWIDQHVKASEQQEEEL